MKKIILILGLAFASFAQDLTLASNGSLTIFPINPGSRGADIVSMFTTLTTAPLLRTNSQVALQTTRNGLITNVQFITPMNNYTILVVGYWTPQDQAPSGNSGKRTESDPKRYGYVALPVEQIVEVIYSPTIMSSSFVFTSQALGGTLPIFSVDLAQRSADIIQAVNLLITPPIANPNSTFSPVSLLTTISGPFYGSTTNSSQMITNGFIPRIVSVSAVPNSTLLLVQFQPTRTNPYLATGEIATVVVAPDQINGINFSQQ
jgi:hypothetical protein